MENGVSLSLLITFTDSTFLSNLERLYVDGQNMGPLLKQMLEYRVSFDDDEPTQARIMGALSGQHYILGYISFICDSQRVRIRNRNSLQLPVFA